jgi:NAD-dependent dihydropyrimidine dehydrogenase PreA subunit
MIREMVKIDEDRCNGCGLCVPNCHEGALQIIDDKARLISDLLCDGLGACIGHCPEGAITIEKREAEAYDEYKVMELMAPKGINTVVAHLKHLKDHNEREYYQQGVNYLEENKDKLDFPVQSVYDKLVGVQPQEETGCGGGCPGAAAKSFEPQGLQMDSLQTTTTNQPSALRQWPVQMHLINPMASYFQGADMVLAADCVAYSLGNFHSGYLAGKSLGIACPKLDSNMEVYLEKLVALIDQAKINTLQVMIMEVPCCGGLLQLAQQAASSASRKVPVKAVTVGIQGEILKEEWV